MRIKTSTFVYSITNLFGVILFYGLVMGINGSLRVEERNPDFGDGLNFLTRAMPVFLLAVLGAVAWGIKAGRDISRRRDYQATLALAGVATAWVTMYVVLRFQA